MKNIFSFVFFAFFAACVFSQDVPVQNANAAFREESAAEVSFMSFKYGTTEDEIKSYLKKHGIKYYTYYESDNNIYSTNSKVYVEISDFSYIGAKFNYASFQCPLNDGNSISEITCKLLTEKDYETFVQHLKKTFRYSDKGGVFYGKSRSNPDEKRLANFASMNDVSYDEIACDKPELKVKYKFGVWRSFYRPLKFPASFKDDYEPFGANDEISAEKVVDARTGKFAWPKSASLKDSGGKKSLVIKFEDEDGGSFSLAAGEAFEFLAYEGKPFGKFKEIRGDMITLEHTKAAHEKFKNNGGYKNEWNGATLTKYTMEHCFGKNYNKRLFSVKIQAGITAIDGNAFFDCEKLQSVELPNTLQSIKNAFVSCPRLEEIKIPSSVKTIGERAFFGMVSERIEIPKGVVEIESYAIADCKELREVFIPETVLKIGGGAFAGCESLERIAVAEGNPNYCAEGGILFTKDRKKIVCCPSAKGDFVVPAGTETIAKGAFFSCGIESVSIPKSVRYIGDEAFYRAKKLKAITIPKGVEAIGRGAFCGSGVESVAFADSKGWNTLELKDPSKPIAVENAKIHSANLSDAHNNAMYLRKASDIFLAKTKKK